MFTLHQYCCGYRRKENFFVLSNKSVGYHPISTQIKLGRFKNKIANVSFICGDEYTFFLHTIQISGVINIQGNL